MMIDDAIGAQLIMVAADLPSTARQSEWK